MTAKLGLITSEECRVNKLSFERTLERARHKFLIWIGCDDCGSELD